MRFQTLGRSVLLLAMVALVACHNKEEASSATPGGDTPEAAMEQSVTLIKNGDFDGFWKHALPPADYANLRADWTHANPNQRPITDDDRAASIRPSSSSPRRVRRPRFTTRSNPRLHRWMPSITTSYR
jgi:hypothetical protein